MGSRPKDSPAPTQPSSRTGNRTRRFGSDPAGPLRRLPAQRRSAERVRRMLDACAEILDESGYEGLSTTQIARRAGVAIGSVYQFFPDKRAITQALTLRYLELFSDRLSGRLAVEPAADWSAAVVLVLDIYVDMHRNVAGFRALHLGDAVDVHLLDPGLGADPYDSAVITERLRGLLVENVGVADTPALSRVLAVAFEAGDAVLKLAFRRHPEGDAQLLAEAERLIRGYLATHLD